MCVSEYVCVFVFIVPVSSCVDGSITGINEGEPPPATAA